MRSFALSQDKLRTESSRSREVTSHSDPDPDAAAGLEEASNHGSSKIPDASGRLVGSSTRIFSSSAVIPDTSPTSESDWILCSSEVSRLLTENDSPVNSIKKS